MGAAIRSDENNETKDANVWQTKRSIIICVLISLFVMGGVAIYFGAIRTEHGNLMTTSPITITTENSNTIETGKSTKTIKLITRKNITEIDMTETEENTSTPKITFNRSITPGSITIPEIPTTKLTLTTTSKATPNSNQTYFFIGNGRCVNSYGNTPFRCANTFQVDISSRGCERYCNSFKPCIGYTYLTKLVHHVKHWCILYTTHRYCPSEFTKNHGPVAKKSSDLKLGSQSNYVCYGRN